MDTQIPLALAVPIALALIGAIGVLWRALNKANDKLDNLHTSHATSLRELHGEHIETAQGVVSMVGKLEGLIDSMERNSR